MTHDTPPKRIWEDRMTDLTREQIEALWAGAAPHKYGNYLHIANLARQLLATMDALAEAQAAQAGVVERAADMIEDNVRHAKELGREIWAMPDLRALADPTGVEALAALRARLDEAQGLIYAARLERNAAEDQEKELAEELRAVRAERDRLAAANAALEAKVAGLVEAAEDAEYDLLQWLECSKSLTAAGFNMDGTADVTAKLTAAISHIKRGKTNG